MAKTIFITGASRGFGKLWAEALLQRGVKVIATARDLSMLDNLVAKYGDNVLSLKLDVNDRAAGFKAVARAKEHFGSIDVLINNAGFGSYGAVEDVPIVDAKYQFDVNVFGAARLAQLVLPYMRAQHFGKIVNISSIGGKFATPMGGWYHASKFALEGLSDSLRNEVKQFGIDVIVIEPGGVKSEWAGIASDHGLKVSGAGVYKNMANKLAAMNARFADRSAEPEVIAKLIMEAISAKSPKTRYSGGFMAAPLLFLRKILTDKMMDKIFSTQMK